MERSLLKLTVEKGIRKGEIVECTTGSNIRVGRYVRGNSFTIRDAAISSNHLLIEFRDDRWVVLDLETSNGTFLNDVQIDAMEPCALNSGDLIKIGGKTSLQVEILKEVDGGFAISELNHDLGGDVLKRRNPGRQKAGVSDSVDVLDGKPNTKRLKLGVEKSEPVEGESEIKLRRNPRRQVVAAANNLKSVVKSEDLEGGPEIKPRRNPRRQVGGTAAGKGKALKLESENVVMSIPEEILNRANSGVDSNREIDNSSSVNNLAPKVVIEEEVGTIDVNVPRSCEELEKITLKEWFDRMELHLPKKIYDISEEIISNMRTKAEQFREFLSQQDGHSKIPA